MHNHKFQFILVAKTLKILVFKKLEINIHDNQAGAPVLTCTILFPEAVRGHIPFGLSKHYSKAFKPHAYMHNQTTNRPCWLQVFIPPRESSILVITNQNCTSSGSKTAMVLQHNRVPRISDLPQVKIAYSSPSSKARRQSRLGRNFWKGLLESLGSYLYVKFSKSPCNGDFSIETPEGLL